MYFKLVLCLYLCIISLFSYAQCDPEPGAIYGTFNEDERGHTLIAKPNGNGFYVGGSKGDSLLLLELDMEGNVVNTTTFDLFPNEKELPSDIIIDSEGMFAILGTSRNEQLGGELFIMRYNAASGQILWLKHYDNAPVHNAYSIIEKGDNGNYLVCADGNFSTSNDAWLFEVEKSSGVVNLNFSKNYKMFNTETIYDILYKDNFIYAVGRFKGGGSVSQFRNAVLKLNSTDGTPVWVKLGHKSENDAARLYGLAATLAADGLVSIIWGDPDGTSVTSTEIFVQKTDFDGNLLWINRYDIPGPNDIPRSILKVNGGYVILANQLATNDVVMFKIDNDGDMVWGQTYSFPTIGNSNFRSGATQIINLNNTLIFTAYGGFQPNLNDIIIVRTDLEGAAMDACVESTPTNIPVVHIQEPVFYSVQPDINVVQPGVTNLNTPVTASNIQPICFSTDTIYTTIEEDICEGESFEGYTTTGVFVDLFISDEGCDSIRTLHLTVIEPVSFSFSHEICSGEEFEGYTVTGIFIDTFDAQTSCDSIRILRLTVIPPVVFTLNKNICHNEVFLGYTISGTYADTFALSNGCDSIRILNLSVFACAPIIYYDLNACRAYMEDGSVMDYSEFTPAYPEGSCAEVSAEILQRIPASENKHSCTPGVNNTIAMCVSSYSSCTYSAGNPAAVIIDFEIDPVEDSLFRLQGLQFYEKAPTTYNWIDGNSGPNNYPRRYGIRILKNGVEVFRNENVATNFNWTLQSYNFIDNDLFRVEAFAEFRIELLPYCPIGNGAAVSAWDIDDVRIIAACLPIDNNSTILGTVSTKDHQPISNVQVLLADNDNFNEEKTSLTDAQGAYTFEEVEPGACYLKGYKNDDVTNGISALDLVHIQRHLLGKTKFTTLHQYVAADVNHNNTVNAIDMIDIQKLLLGKTTEFPRNTSWRFGSLPQEMNGDDISQFRELHQMEITDPGTYEADLVGIKIGDLNGDVELITAPRPIEERSAKSFALVIEEHNSVLNIKAGDVATIAGMQFALQIKNFNSIQSGKLQLEANNYSITADGTFRLVWTAKEILSVSAGEVLFSIVLKTDQPVSVMTNEVLSPELYTDELQAIKLDLVFENNLATAQSVDRFSIEPNPFQSEINIKLNLAEEGGVKISFYDLSGRLLYHMNNSYLAGEHNEQIAGSLLGMNEGVLYCQIVSNGLTSTQRIVKLR